MAKKKKHHAPSAKAKAKYYSLIEKGYKRTRATLLKHNPSVVHKTEGA
jgi:hypothetical protein